MKKLLVFAAAALVFAAACGDATAPGDASHCSRDNVATGRNQAECSFIVTVSDGISPEAVASDHGVTPHFVYHDVLHGFAAWLSDSTHDALLKDARVEMIEADGMEFEQATQSGATWGIDRVDQRALPLNGTYTYTSSGAGVTAYIIDTGILLSHNEFGGRAVKGFDAITAGGDAQDCNGHGTHVAGTVGGATYGIAKAVKLVAVRVLNCGGSSTTSTVIAGVDWVTHNHAPNAVANMSLGGSASAMLDNAVAASIASGVTYVLAAGNSRVDACGASPARLPAAITVGATDATDTRASFSNLGGCLDIFAPGVNINAAWHTSRTATHTISGTSMAAPHVAGVAALYVASHPGATPQQVRDALVANATSGAVKNGGAGSPNTLLFSSY
jgi:subtilisin family serine protease